MTKPPEMIRGFSHLGGGSGLGGVFSGKSRHGIFFPFIDHNAIETMPQPISGFDQPVLVGRQAVFGNGFLDLGCLFVIQRTDFGEVVGDGLNLVEGAAARHQVTDRLLVQGQGFAEGHGLAGVVVAKINVLDIKQPNRRMAREGGLNVNNDVVDVDVVDHFDFLGFVS